MENWQILVDPFIENGNLRILDQDHTDPNSLDIRDLNHLIYIIPLWFSSRVLLIAI